jgi:hypothetical protein
MVQDVLKSTKIDKYRHWPNDLCINASLFGVYERTNKGAMELIRLFRVCEVPGLNLGPGAK